MKSLHAEIIIRVRSFIKENFLYMHSDFHLADDDRLLEKGLMDSMSVVEMIAFVESEFGIQTTANEISEMNFGSLDGIARFVAGKRERLVS